MYFLLMSERIKKGSPQPALITEQTAARSSGKAAVNQLDPFAPIRDLALRDLEAQKKTPEQLAADFQEAIRKSGAFSWIGVYERRDPDLVGVPAVEVYLAEKTEITPDVSERVAGVVAAFADLTLSLRPNNLDPHLHLMEERYVPVLREELESRRVGPETYNMVFEGQL